MWSSLGRCSALLAVLVAGGGCARQPGPDRSAVTAPASSENARGRATAARPLVAKGFRYRFAIYTERPPAFDLAPEIERAAKAAGFRLSSQPGDLTTPTTPSSLFWAQPGVEAFPPPDLASLEYSARGLSAAQKNGLAGARAVTVLELTGAGVRALEDYPKAVELGRALSRSVSGYFWDDETRNAFSADTLSPATALWADGLPDVTKHVTVHVYRDGELMRLVSLGMIKFGLPDIVINQVPSSYAHSMVSLMNLVMQTLIERGTLDGPNVLHATIDGIRHPGLKSALGTDLKAGAKGSVELTLVPATRVEGDADNRLLEITFPGPPETLQERQDAAVVQLFGADDAIVHVQHDAKLLDASRRARQKALALKPRFEHGPPFGETLLVKGPFQTPKGGKEWMWVEVTAWKGSTISGILQNDPFEIPALKAGARVQVPADQIFDYILKKRDGTLEGNETAKLLERE